MSKIVLIQEPDVLISLDLVQTVLDLWPDSTLILSRTANEAMNRLAGLPHLDVAILRLSLQAAQAPGLGRAALDKGARVLLTEGGDSAAGAPPGFVVLDVPFSTAGLRQALHPEE